MQGHDEMDDQIAGENSDDIQNQGDKIEGMTTDIIAASDHEQQDDTNTKDKFASLSSLIDSISGSIEEMQNHDMDDD